MDYQVLFNLAILIAGFFGGWILSNISKAIERLDADVRELPQFYVAKDDYRQSLERIENMLERIFDKLDGKADK
ncbi:MAG: hypothetical protein ACR2K1_04120 [Saprospiraceae bacterium]